MLKRLFIRNYILIDELDIQFENGLTIITGETGAGKSILLGALSLILGQRADTGALLDKKKKCIIEGVFETGNDLRNFFESNELDYDTEICLRREINAEGKSRAFINDTPVNLILLRELASSLIDVHSQHETLTLANSRFQLSVVDAFAAHDDVLDDFRRHYYDYIKSKKELQELLEAELRAKADQDYYQFQLNELQEAHLKPDEQEQLEKELLALTHAGEIRQQLEGVYAIIDGSDENILQMLTSNSLSTVAKYDAKYALLADRIRSMIIELKDISAEAEQLMEAISADPLRAEQVSERLDVIYTLQQKHRVGSIEELLQLQGALANKLTGIGTLEQHIGMLQRKTEEDFRLLTKKAQKISAKRMHVIPEIEKAVSKLTDDLAMPNARLSVHNDASMPEQMNADGIDRITFYFAANKGSESRELGKVASGGEFSRLMLAIKSLLAGLTSLPTIIFDEIDTGISGEVAARVGGIMQKMSAKHQVIAITHLPQIAGKGKEHLLVYKNDSAKTTRTGIRKLTSEERINEIARMLSGQKLTGAAIEHAKELLSI